MARNTDGPLADEFARVLQEMQIGLGRGDALRALGERTNAARAASFVTAMVQADAFGIPIAQVLRVQSSEMRVKRRQRAEEKAQKVPVKILFPLIFFILPCLFIAVMGPAALSIMDSVLGATEPATSLSGRAAIGASVAGVAPLFGLVALLAAFAVLSGDAAIARPVLVAASASWATARRGAAATRRPAHRSWRRRWSALPALSGLRSLRRRARAALVVLPFVAGLGLGGGGDRRHCPAQRDASSAWVTGARPQPTIRLTQSCWLDLQPG